MPRSDAGWTDSALELAKIQLLDRVHDETEKGRGTDTSQFLGDISDDERLLKTAAKALDSESLAKAVGDYDGGIALLTTPSGDALAETRRERWANRKLRSGACRDALLDWCYAVGEVANIGNFAGAVQSHFEGDPFTEDEINQASLVLKEKALVTGAGSMGGGIAKPSLTVAGKSVVEDYDSSIRAYETRNQPPQGSTTSFNFGSGNFSGQFTFGDHNQVTQTNGSTSSELANLLKAVLDAANGTGDEERVAKIVAQLELEADEDSPEPTIITKALDRLEDTATKAGSTALVAAVTQLIQYVHAHGIPQMFGMG